MPRGPRPTSPGRPAPLEAARPSQCLPVLSGAAPSACGKAASAAAPPDRNPPGPPATTPPGGTPPATRSALPVDSSKRRRRSGSGRRRPSRRVGPRLGRQRLPRRQHRPMCCQSVAPGGRPCRSARPARSSIAPAPAAKRRPSPCPARRRACHRSPKPISRAGRASSLNFSSLSKKSSLTPVWNVLIASTARSYRACTAAFELFSSALAAARACWHSSRVSATGTAAVGRRLHGEHRRQAPPPPPAPPQPRRSPPCGAARASAPARRVERLSPGRDRLVGHPAIQIVGQRPGRGVAILGLRRHGLQADGLQSLVERRLDAGTAVEIAPSCTARKTAPMSSPSNGGLPVSRQ